MGYLTAPETDHLALPSNGEYWVKMKRKATFGDGEAAKGAMIKISQAQPNGHAGDVVTEAEVSAYNTVLISRLVVEWNLTDQFEKVIPITPAMVELLDSEDGDFLAAEATKRLGRRPEAEQAPFGKRSGRSSTGTK